MNIKDFLVENYIYIIIVIILTIITIIGFLADKKKNGDKRPKTMSGTVTNSQNTNIGNMNYQQPTDFNQPINYQPMNNNPINYNQLSNPNNIPNNMLNVSPVQDNFQMNMLNNQPVNTNSQINPIFDNQNMNFVNNQQIPDNQNVNIVNNQPITNTIPNQPNEINYNIPQPVESLNQNTSTPIETMYQPLSEQKPTFAPVEPNINNLNNSIPNNMPQNNLNTIPNIINQSNSQTIEQTPNIITPPPVQFESQPSVAMPIPNQMPMNQPVGPIPNIAENTIPNPITPPQPVSPQQINFVYGANEQNQGNNNQFMQ